jgi:tetratricopeptide (TPR) repeat protein
MSADAVRRAGALPGAALLCAALAVAALAPGATASSAGDALREARALEAAGKPDEAETLLRRALESGVVDRDPAILLAVARLTPLPDESLELCREVIAASRNAGLVAAAHALRGDYLYALGSYQEAAAEYEAAAAGGTAEARALASLERAASLLAAGDAPAAEEAYRTLLSSKDDAVRSRARLGVGRALLAQGRARDAAGEFEGAAAAGPDGRGARLEALAGAAAAWEAAGDVGRAAAALGVIVQDYPGTSDAVLAEERLRALAESPETAPAAVDSAAAPPAF